MLGQLDELVQLAGLGRMLGSVGLGGWVAEVDWLAQVGRLVEVCRLAMPDRVAWLAELGWLDEPDLGGRTGIRPKMLPILGEKPFFLRISTKMGLISAVSAEKDENQGNKYHFLSYFRGFAILGKNK